MRCRQLFVVVLIGIGVAACGAEVADTTEEEAATTTTVVDVSTTTEAPTTTTTALRTSTTIDDEADGVDGIDFDFLDPATFATVELVDAGSEPREVRTWEPPVGTLVSMTMAITTESQQTAEGAESISTDFTASVDSETEILSMAEDGFVGRTVFTSAAVSSSDPFTEGALDAAYTSLIGMEIHQITRPDGAIIAQAGIDELGQGDVLGNGLGGIAAPIPSEPIGIGAIWVTNQVIDVEGIRIVQTVTTRLVDVQGDLLFIELEAVSSLDPSSNAPGLGSVTLEGTSTGTAVWDLSIGMPTSAFSESIQVVQSDDPAAPFTVRTVTTVEVAAEAVE